MWLTLRGKGIGSGDIELETMADLEPYIAGYRRAMLVDGETG